MRASRAEVDRTLAALADPVRRAVVERLGEGPVSAGGLADALDVSRPVMSKHLKTLREAGLVEQAIDAADARVRTVTLRRAPLAHVRGWLDEVEAFWGDQLASFKAHAEAKARRPR